MHPYFSKKYFSLGHCVLLLPVDGGKWQWWWFHGDEVCSDERDYPTQDAARAASNRLADELLAERIEDELRHKGKN